MSPWLLAWQSPSALHAASRSTSSTALLRIAVAYTLVALFGLPVFSFLLALPVSLPAERLAHIGAVGLVTVYSFLAHRHISFAGGFRNRLRARTTMVS